MTCHLKWSCRLNIKCFCCDSQRSLVNNTRRCLFMMVVVWYLAGAEKSGRSGSVSNWITAIKKESCKQQSFYLSGRMRRDNEKSNPWMPISAWEGFVSLFPSFLSQGGKMMNTVAFVSLPHHFRNRIVSSSVSAWAGGNGDIKQLVIMWDFLGVAHDIPRVRNWN